MSSQRRFLFLKWVKNSKKWLIKGFSFFLVSCSSSPIIDVDSLKIAKQLELDCSVPIKARRDGGVLKSEIRKRISCLSDFLKYYQGIDREFLELYLWELNDLVQNASSRQLEEVTYWKASELDMIHNSILSEVANRDLVMNGRSPYRRLSVDELNLIGAKFPRLDTNLSAFYRRLNQDRERLKALFDLESMRLFTESFSRVQDRSRDWDRKTILDKKLNELQSALTNALKFQISIPERSKVLLALGVLEQLETDFAFEPCAFDSTLIEELLKGWDNFQKAQILDRRFQQNQIVKNLDSKFSMPGLGNLNPSVHCLYLVAYYRRQR